MVDSTIVKITGKSCCIKDKLIDIDQRQNFVQLKLKEYTIIVY